MLCCVIVEGHSRIQELLLQEKVQQLLQAANLEDVDMQSLGQQRLLGGVSHTPGLLEQQVETCQVHQSVGHAD